MNYFAHLPWRNLRGIIGQIYATVSKIQGSMDQKRVLATVFDPNIGVRFFVNERFDPSKSVDDYIQLFIHEIKHSAMKKEPIVEKIEVTVHDQNGNYLFDESGKQVAELIYFLKTDE